jgi:hypothetical protein
MKAYWWRNQRNFGDALTPILLREFAGVTAQWTKKEQAEILVCGSVLQGLPTDWSGTVLGSGRLRPGRTELPNARLLALRGPLSFASTYSGPMPDPVAYGDPALLVSRMIQWPTLRWDVGVVPHWSDTGLIEEAGLPGDHIIDVAADPLEVVEAIASCRRIVTSSLHGLIVADAFGIPATAVMCSRVEEEGGTFKFMDYWGSLGVGEGFGVSRAAPANRIVELQDGLLKAFKEVA